ncbi:MAG: hypothetical protein FWE95_07150 [Planctomycetaceae bacterium]|nr:hypothetical protein [Planctomycetaceae bacterium]
MRNLFFLFSLTSFACHCSATEILISAADSVSHTGNYVRAESNWSNLGVLHGERGSINWKFSIETAGVYHVQALYASGERRPVTLTLKNEKSGTTQSTGNLLGEPTGGFHAPNLKWDTLGIFVLAANEYTMTIDTRNYLPHLRGFRITTDGELPKGDIWQERIKQEQWEIERPQMAATREELRTLLPEASEILFIKRAPFQSSHYYTDFIDGCVYFGSELCLLSLEDGSVKSIVPELAEGIIGRCNLSFDGTKVIFDYKRRIGEGFRIWEVNIDGTGLRQLTFPPEDEAARIAKYRQNWHAMYHHHTDDLHPVYLPDGGFCFVSTRCEFGVLCDGPDILTVSVLYRADKDGNNMEKLSNSSLSESAPSITNDGRILYTRWEYIDNGSVTNKGLWSMRPDGTGSADVYGRNMAFPSVYSVGRAVPGSNSLFVCIGAPHMPLGVGTIMLIDSSKDKRTSEPVTYITPEVDGRHQWGWDNIPGGATKPFRPEGLIQTTYGYDGRGNTSRGPLFMDPLPLNAHQVLASYNRESEWNTVDAYGLYLIDDNGGRKPLHREEGTSCWNPLPVQPREIPRSAHGGINPLLAQRGLAQLTVTDVHIGLDGVAPGTVKYIRINEQVPRPWEARRFWGGDEHDQQHSVITDRTHLGLKVQIGVVPVEADGSANFLVPADKNIFFQALDENYMEVQRGRTFVNYRPGEFRSCAGCHENTETVQTLRMPVALRREPSLPGPQPGEVSGHRALHYPTDVQPFLDKYCISCHGAENPRGGLNLTGELTERFSRSYEELMKRDIFPMIRENHPKAGNNHYLPPYTLGSHASQLFQRMTDSASPCFVQPTREEMIRFTTWIDSNGQYYGTYFGKKNLRYKDEPDFRIVPEL